MCPFLLDVLGALFEQIGEALVSREGDPQFYAGADDVLVSGCARTGGVLSNLYREVDQSRDGSDRGDQFT